MKIMLYEWDAFMQADMEDVLKRMNIRFRVFWYPFRPKLTDEDPYFEKHFTGALSVGDYDAVFSFNFKSVVAKCCAKLSIPYIAWVFDSPFGITEKPEILRLPTNYVFIFDRYVYQMMKAEGYNTVYHMPLAVNQERLDAITISEEDEKRYGADVSFVGTLYSSTFGGFRSKLPPYELGQVESVIQAQMMIYGGYYLDQFTDEKMCKRLREVLGEPDDSDERLFHEGVQSIISKEITRRERLTLLYLISQDHNVALYSNRTERMLDKVDYRGVIDSYEEVYRVYKTSRINLNISFKRIVDGIPLRAMDIMGAGGFLLSNYQSELVEEFEPGVDCEVYESIADAVEKVKYYLEHDDKRKEIADHGHQSMKRFAFEKQLKKIFNTVAVEKREPEKDDSFDCIQTASHENIELDDGRITEGMDEFTSGYIRQMVLAWKVIGDPALIQETLTDDVVNEAIRVWGGPDGLNNPYDRMCYVAEEIQRRCRPAPGIS